MSRDPLRDRKPPLPGEQRGKHDAQDNEDRGAGRRPGQQVLAPTDHDSLPVPASKAPKK